jgi:hypothetical protein
VAAERDLRFGREVAHAPGVAGPRRKRRLGVADVACEGLHEPGIGQLRGNDDAGRIATNTSVGKGIEPQHVHHFFLFNPRAASGHGSRCL